MLVIACHSPGGGAARPRRARAGLAIAALAVVIAAAAISVLVSRNRSGASGRAPISFTAVPLTTYQGREEQPAFSPDGNAVAFTWNGESEDNWDIYVKQIGPASPLRLTTDPATDLSPAWSRDGRSIAFLRVQGDRATLIIVPSLGGPERQVVDVVPAALGAAPVLTWSADSRLVIVATSLAPEGQTVLTAVDAASGEARQITTPPLGGRGDSLPSVSPDGRTLAFVRRSGVLTGAVYVQSVSERFAPIGDPRRIGAEGLLNYGITWGADGRNLIASMGNAGNIGLWRIPLKGPEQAERLTRSGEDCRQPTVALEHHRLVYTRAASDENVWRVSLSAPGQVAGAPVNVVDSTWPDLNAQFSPDGTRVAFESFRSGTQEIWVADQNGRNALQLTSLGGRRGGTPAWSPDGQWIAFDWRDESGQGDIYVISAHGGVARRVTNHPSEDLVPTWSRDGRWIYFGSTRTGGYQIWKLPPQGGDAIQVTRHGGTYAKESVDGRFLYYAKLETALPSLWRIPAGGGEEIQILRELAVYGNFAVARDGIYFESPPAGSSLRHTPMFTASSRPGAAIDFLSFATVKINRVLTLTRYAGNGMDVSADGRTLLFGQMDSLTEDLMLVENFR
jgi:Tol biopolymer transport system component